MCGIAGIARVEGVVDQNALARMADSMAHRGPDEAGVHLAADQRVGLAHRRLKIIDLAGGQQPMGNEDGSVVVVFNGEIYNFQALRAELEIKGHIFSCRSDTEVLVHLYEEMGAAFVGRLRGMFAFALFDSRDKSLLLARDRMGKKPLYYGALGNAFCFASELRALMQSGLLSRQLDPEAFDRFFSLSYIPAPRTIFAQARKLPPGHCLMWRDGGISTWRYWDLDLARKTEMDVATAAAVVRDKIEEAVRIRLVSDVPLGAFLSGGIDSSLVSAFAARSLGRPLDTFTIGFSDPRYDERAYARLVARHLGTTHHEFLVTPVAVEILPELVRFFGEPYGDFSALPMWHLARETKKHVTVALSGDGGDELFAGYDRHWRYFLYNGIHRWLPAGVRAGLMRLTAPFAARIPAAARMHRGLEIVSRGGGRLFGDLNTFVKEGHRSETYTPALRSLLEDSAEAEFERIFDALPGSDLDRILYLDATTYESCQLAKVDSMCMAWSMEPRNPLVDHEVVETVFALPDEMKLDGVHGKVLLRKIAADYLPAAIVNRRKQGFTVPLKLWFRGFLKGYAEERIMGGRLAATGWLSEDFLAQTLASHFSGHRDQTYTLWNLLVLAEWLEMEG